MPWCAPEVVKQRPSEEIALGPGLAIECNWRRGVSVGCDRRCECCMDVFWAVADIETRRGDSDGGAKIKVKERKEERRRKNNNRPTGRRRKERQAQREG